MFFSTHARSVTILCAAATGSEKSMSQYLIDQLAKRSNIHTRLGAEVSGRTASPRWRRSTYASARASARSPATTRAGCSSSSARTRRPDGYQTRSRATSAACADRPGHERAWPWKLDRDPYLLGDERWVSACGDVRYGPVKRVAAAVGEGSMSIAFVHQFLRDAGVTEPEPVAAARGE